MQNSEQVLQSKVISYSYCSDNVLPTSSFINCANTQSLLSMRCSVTDGQCVPWAAPGLNGWLYRGWRPPHHRQLCPRLTCSTVSPGHWNNKYYKIQTVATVNFKKESGIRSAKHQHFFKDQILNNYPTSCPSGFFRRDITWKQPIKYLRIDFTNTVCVVGTINKKCCTLYLILLGWVCFLSWCFSIKQKGLNAFLIYSLRVHPSTTRCLSECEKPAHDITQCQRGASYTWSYNQPLDCFTSLNLKSNKLNLYDGMWFFCHDYVN